jgi:hypothetical protein
LGFGGRARDAAAARMGAAGVRSTTVSGRDPASGVYAWCI